ncbi:GNAT family N-acetyltransferase [Parasedimentitalea huanghaiensis]|uniref:GNAT family N-acetyltransferase n=1 Tax=Parasedimentitalea huanghaiensis TaxID=2682100 RepID=UPI001430ABE6
MDEILPLAKSTVPGFVEHLWSRLAEGDETKENFGRRAQSAFINEGNTIVADVDGRIGAMLISYQMADSPNPHLPGMDDMLRPLLSLFSKAKGSWYLHGIATAPEFVGRGLASQLMDIAEYLGKSARRPNISLVVIDTNPTAIRFYEKRGYTTTAVEAVIRKNWKTYAKNWLLMEKALH